MLYQIPCLCVCPGLDYFWCESGNIFMQKKERSAYCILKRKRKVLCSICASTYACIHIKLIMYYESRGTIKREQKDAAASCLCRLIAKPFYLNKSFSLSGFWFLNETHSFRVDFHCTIALFSRQKGSVCLLSCMLKGAGRRA